VPHLQQLAFNPSIHINLDTISPRTFPINSAAIDELVEIGREEMPDARGISEFGTHCPLVDTEARVTQGSEIGTSGSNPLHDWVPMNPPSKSAP
jgi:hypothetical protein